MSNWKTICRFTKYNLTLKGSSFAGKMTSFYIPELHTLFDAGIQTTANIENILVTHCHSDHSYALAQLLVEQYKQNKKPKAYVPIELLQLFGNYIDAFHKLNEGDENATKDYLLYGVSEYNIIDLGNKYHATVYNLNHTVPTRGYGIWKDDNEKLFAYITDTYIDIFDGRYDLFDYPYIIVECSYIDIYRDNRDKKRKHISWEALQPIVKAHQNINFILIHLTQKYSRTEQIDFFNAQGLQNIIVGC